MKQQILDAILSSKLVAILRGVPDEQLIPLLEALYHGGVRLAEITFDAKGIIPPEKTAQQIARSSAHFQGRMHIGAGTVLTVQQADLAVDAGAGFLISPNVDEAVIRTAVRRGVVSMPGAVTPTEAVNAVKAGADLVKIFPSDNLGPKYFKAICAPLSHIKFIAVGGVDHLNVGDFLKAGAVGVGVGSNIVNKEMLKKGDYAGITALAKTYVEAIEQA